MANVDFPAGLRPVGNGKAGTAPQMRPYTRSSTGVIYEGDPLQLAIAHTGPEVFNGTTAADALRMLGSAAHYVGASDTEIFVYDDPDQEYLIQGDSLVATPFGAIGKVCNLLNMATGNATTLQSKCELDSSELTSVYAAGDVLQVVRLWKSEDNDQDALNAKWVVKIRSDCHVFVNDATNI